MTGTPGVGKSMFLHHKQLIEAQRKEISDIVVTRCVLLLPKKRKKFIKINDEERSRILNRLAIHLCDPLTAANFPEHKAFIVFFVSPTVDKIGYFHLKRILSYYMTPWNKKN